MFEQKSTQSLLSLLAMTALADKRLYACEIDCFVRVAMKLNKRDFFEDKLSEPKLLMWFELNRDRLKGQMRTPGFKDWYNECLSNLKSDIDKQNILNAMMQISSADDEIHYGEVALVKLTARIWNMPVPANSNNKTALAS